MLSPISEQQAASSLVIAFRGREHREPSLKQLAILWAWLAAVTERFKTLENNNLGRSLGCLNSFVSSVQGAEACLELLPELAWSKVLEEKDQEFISEVEKNSSIQIRPNLFHYLFRYFNSHYAHILEDS